MKTKFIEDYNGTELATIGGTETVFYYLKPA